MGLGVIMAYGSIIDLQMLQQDKREAPNAFPLLPHGIEFRKNFHPPQSENAPPFIPLLRRRCSPVSTNTTGLGPTFELS